MRLSISKLQFILIMIIGMWMKKIYFVCLIAFFILNLRAEDISELLQKLNNTEELYHKTKVESAGLLILYTRDDLERMQAYKLKDVLKSLRFFTYKEGYIGESALSPSGGSSVVSPMFRLYIDNHEVSSSIYGSSMLQFSELDLGFVDHIEIYEGGNAISFGNEPGLVTIRIYSKEPTREKGSTLALQGDSEGSKTSKICYTDTFNDNKQSVLLYALLGKTDRKELYGNGSNYSKDTTNNTFYTRYIFKDKGSISAGYFAKEKDAFVGVGMAHTPIEPNRVDRKHLFLNIQYLLPNAFELNLSADNIKHNMLFSDTNKIRIVQNPNPFTYFDGKFSETLYKATLKQNIEHNKGDFKWGLQGIKKSYKINHMLMDGNDSTTISGPSKLNIFSVFGEERFNIDENNLLIGTIKFDNYSDNFNAESHTEYIARLGYIHLFSSVLSSKIFISRTYLYPGFAYTSTFPNNYFSNSSLGAEHHNFIIGELKYNTSNDTTKIGGVYKILEDKILLDSGSRMFVNSSKKNKTIRVYANYTHHFNSLNKISTEIYNTYFIGDDIVKKSSMTGAYIRSINTIGRFDIFNELIYRSSYTYPLPAYIGGPINIKSGYDYNVGVKWHINNAFTLSVKGENIFGKASKTPIYGLGAVDNLDRRVMAQVEYFF